ncbi:MAG: VOC family protein [Candidatus Bathyarchaeia archaeon]
MVSNFDWVEIGTRDIRRAAIFYENVFGWKTVEKETIEGFDHWVFDTGKTSFHRSRGGIWVRPRDENLGVLVYIAVDDIKRTLEKVTKQGGKVVVSKTLVEPHGYKACFIDPDGNLFALWESLNKE